MRERGGSIVLTASEAGVVGTSGETVYSATKAGVIALIKSLAREYARFGIRVNAVAPGITDTPLLESQGGESLLEHRAPGAAASRRPAGGNRRRVAFLASKRRATSPVRPCAWAAVSR